MRITWKLALVGAACWTYTGTPQTSVPTSVVHGTPQTNMPTSVVRRTPQMGVLTPSVRETPRINGARIFGVRPGHPVLWRIPVSGARPMAVEVRGLPEGVVYDAKTRSLTGTTTQRGDHDVLVTATNAKGVATRRMTLRVGDTLCLTPPMGWNSWNCWGQEVSDARVRKAADTMVATGLADHGWNYIVVDDCWRTRPTEQVAGFARPKWIGEKKHMYGPDRLPDGTPATNALFPDMRALADHIHGRGLRAGLYSVPSAVACCYTFGSWQHEQQDAETWAKWGYDLVKYDWCYGDRQYAGTAKTKRDWQFQAYRKMGDFLARQPRDIVYNICNYGVCDVTEWARAAGGHYWRTNDDVKDSWKLLLASIDGNLKVAYAAGPGGWNDPDMLVIGPMRSNGFTKSRLTPNEQYTHMSLWAIQAAPLFIGCDMDRLAQDPLAWSFLTNDEVIDIDQDELGKVGKPVVHTAEHDVWARPLADGSWAVALFNRTEEPRRITARFADFGAGGCLMVRDVWAQQDIATYSGSFTAEVYGHATRLFRLRAIDPSPEAAACRRCPDSPGDCAYAKIEREVVASDQRNQLLQAALSGRCAVTDFASLVRTVDGEEVWTAAFQKALDTAAIVTIPARTKPYLIDGTLHIPSNHRIEAQGATVRLFPGTRTIMLRNVNTKDGTKALIPSDARDTNIAILGGRWEDCRTSRGGFGTSGVYDTTGVGFGNFQGVTTFFLFNNCDHVTVKDVTFAYCGATAIQAGMGNGYRFENIVFEGCFADGLHLNGGLTRVHAKNVRGSVGDDLVALNAYDWLNSSVTFAPQRFFLCEDLELTGGYPAIRILPGTYRFPDGSKIDCAINDVIFRRVSGVTNWKLYLQPPAYTVGNEPEWGEVGSGGNIFFEQMSIDLASPPDGFSVYTGSDPVRGHFGAFEVGANLSSVTFRDLDVTFHADRYPLSHLVTVGPKSATIKRETSTTEIFAPYLSCTVGVVRVENVRCHGVVPKELVHATSFDNVNADGRSTGRGIVKEVR